VNPRLPTTYGEVGRWLGMFAASHVKREDPRLEVQVDDAGPREGRSYGVRVAYPTGAKMAQLELTYEEAAEGRTRFSWCAELGGRLRALARIVVGDSVDARASG
jgi:hypothetical protein